MKTVSGKVVRHSLA